jgi:RNA polymerase sigma-70 factor, ECF subfamily
MPRASKEREAGGSASMDKPDNALVAAAKSGDRKAFEALIERHYDRIHRVAWRHCGNPSEAEDIAQEVCIRIARSLVGFEGRAAFTTWCHGIAVNVVRDWMRARARAVAAHAEASLLILADGAAAPVEDQDDELWQAVRALPERQREAVELVYVEGLSHRDAARAIGCAEATVSWHLFAARKTLRSLLSRRQA